jgi:TolB-like protein/Flp pilus assembly protein TadD
MTAMLIAAYVAIRTDHARKVQIKALAVLPFKNLSGDPSQEYLADGMTEALVGRLAQIPGLRVISRTSAMHFKDTKLSVPEIAKLLAIDTIVEGSVIREGNQVRVHAQLIRAATDEHIWAEEYQRPFAGVLAVEEDVAQRISGRTENTINSKHISKLPIHQPDPEAHEYYLKGRYLFNQRTEEAVNRSITSFQEAITTDPNYALAYSGLSDAYAWLGFRGGIPSKEALGRAKAAALKAIDLDPSLSEPHASLAFLAETHEWDWSMAESEYKLALQLNPSDARAHSWYAGYLMYMGRFDEGIAEAMFARDLDPLSLPVNNALAGRLLVADRINEARKQLKVTMDLDSHFAPAHQTLGWLYLDEGRNEEAIKEFQEAVQLAGGTETDFLLDVGFACAAAGRREEALEILTELKRGQEQGKVPSGSIGILYGALGEFDQAFAWLDRAYAERDPELTYLKVPKRRFEPLRRDPRFKKLVHRMGLPT